jgi:hypothetical protein
MRGRFRRTTTVILMGVVTGCAAKPLRAIPRPDPHLTCGSPMMQLYFVEGSDRLAYPANYALGNYPDLHGVCGRFELTVFGLADPSEDSLDGRRARTTAQLIQNLGWPQPRFVRGNAEDQQYPSIFLSVVTDEPPRAQD